MKSLSFTTMQWIDRNVGTIAVLLLALFRLVGYPFRKQNNNNPKTVLVQKFFGLGSIVNAIPLFSLIKRDMPEARILLLSLRENQELIEFGGWVDEAIYIDISNIWRFLATTLQAVKRMNELQVDVCLDLEFFTRFSAITAFLSRAPIRTGFYGYNLCRNLLFTHHIPFNHYTHISQVFLAHSSALDLEPDKKEVQVKLPALDKDDTARIMNKFGLRKNGYILINPNSSELCLNRRWPDNYFARLAEMIANAKDDMDILFVGGGSEVEYTQQVVGLIDNGTVVRNLAGKTNLIELLHLISASGLVITNDSLPVHIASGYGADMVAMFGPETPILYGPTTPNSVVMFAGLYCSPCINALDNKSYRDCRTPKCMTSISVDEVMEEVTGFLDKRERPSHDSGTG